MFLKIDAEKNFIFFFGAQRIKFICQLNDIIYLAQICKAYTFMLDGLGHPTIICKILTLTML